MCIYVYGRKREKSEVMFFRNHEAHRDDSIYWSGSRGFQYTEPNNGKGITMSKRFLFYEDWIGYAALVLVLMCLGVSCTAYAEEQRRTCSEEIAKYCKGIKPGGGRLLVCLKEHEKDLTSACREKLAEIEKRLEEAKQICAADTEKFCKGIQPGEGRIAKCLKEHIQDISPGCREKVHGLKQLTPQKKSLQ